MDLTSPDGPRGDPRPRRRADVFVENFTPGVVGPARLRLRGGRARSSPTSSTARSRASARPGRWRLAPGLRPHHQRGISGIMHLEQGDEPRPARLEPPGRRRARRHPRLRRHPGRALRRGAHRQGAYLDVSMLEALVGRRQRHLRLRAERRRGARQPAARHGRLRDRRPVRRDADRRGAAALAAPARVDGPAGAGGGSALRRRPTAGGNWRALRDIIGEWLDPLRHRGRGARGARARRAFPARPCCARRGHRAAAPGRRAGSSPPCRIPARGPCSVTASPYHLDGRPVAPARPGGVPRGRAHARGAERRPRLRADRIAGLLGAGVIEAP